MKAGAEDDLAARPSHHDAEGEHDHDDFDTFVVDDSGARATRTPDRSAASRRRPPRHPAHQGLSSKSRASRCGCWCKASGRASASTSTGRGRADEARRSRLVVIGQKGSTAPRSRRARPDELAMHILRIEIADRSTRRREAVDLGQTPADIVFLSFSDSDLNALARACERRARARKPTSAAREPRGAAPSLFGRPLRSRRCCAAGASSWSRACSAARITGATASTNWRRLRAEAESSSRSLPGDAARRRAARRGLDRSAGRCRALLALFRRGRRRQYGGLRRPFARRARRRRSLRQIAAPVKRPSAVFERPASRPRQTRRGR